MAHEAVSSPINWQFMWLRNQVTWCFSSAHDMQTLAACDQPDKLQALSALGTQGESCQTVDSSGWHSTHPHWPCARHKGPVKVLRQLQLLFNQLVPAAAAAAAAAATACSACVTEHAPIKLPGWL
jgi:hypothetical protein